MEKTGRGPGKKNPLVLNWIPTPDWMEAAACAEDEDPELYFRKDPAEAKATCGWCRVRLTCLRFAIENGIGDGVWGGLSKDERRELKPSAPGLSRGRAPAA